MVQRDTFVDAETTYAERYEIYKIRPSFFESEIMCFEWLVGASALSTVRYENGWEKVNVAGYFLFFSWLNLFELCNFDSGRGDDLLDDLHVRCHPTPATSERGA